MYTIGEKVVYGGHGVCLIAGIEERYVDRKTVSYFVLTPIDRDQTQFFVPVHNPAALAKLRYPLTREELTQLLRSPKLAEDCWIPEDNRRKNRFKELINGGDFLAIAQMLHAVMEHRKKQLAAGKKFHICDENFLRDAKRILDSEISVVLGIPVNQVSETLETLINE